MRMAATVVGGGLLALLGLGLFKAAMGGLLAVLMFLGALLLKLAFGALMVWLAVKLLKNLFRPHEKEA